MGKNSWIHPPFLFATSGPTKRREHYFCLLFSQYCVCYFFQYCLKSKTELPFEKSIPGLPRLEPHRKVNATTWCKFLKLLKLYEKRPTCFQTLTFCWTQSNIEKITNNNNVSDVSWDQMSRTKRGDESKNYFPPIPPTRIPLLLIPDHFY